jgi:hypothetical protein
MLLLVGALVAAACGGGGTRPIANERSSSSASPAAPAGPTCKEVAAHVMSLAEHDVTTPEGEAKMLVIIEKRCDTDTWSEPARGCFVKAQADPDLEACDKLLTPAQRAAFRKDQGG